MTSPDDFPPNAGVDFDHNLDGMCEWPVESRFFGQPARTCGRPGHGKHLRVCWQHRDAMYAAVAEDLRALGGVGDSRLIARVFVAWIEGSAPSEWDTPERAAEKEKSRRGALAAIHDVLAWYGSDGLPPFLAEQMDGLVDAQIDRRLKEQWSA